MLHRLPNPLTIEAPIPFTETSQYFYNLIPTAGLVITAKQQPLSLQLTELTPLELTHYIVIYLKINQVISSEICLTMKN